MYGFRNGIRNGGCTGSGNGGHNGSGNGDHNGSGNGDHNGSNKGAEHFKYAEGEPSAVDLTRERALREEIERLNVVVGQMKGKGEFGHTTEISDRLNQLSAILSEKKLRMRRN